MDKARPYFYEIINNSDDDALVRDAANRGLDMLVDAAREAAEEYEKENGGKAKNNMNADENDNADDENKNDNKNNDADEEENGDADEENTEEDGAQRSSRTDREEDNN